MVRSESEWKRVWRELVDTLPAPAVNFRDSVVVIAATREFTNGPYRIEYVDIRQCGGDGDVLVLLRLHGGSPRQDYGDRSIRAVELARSAMGDHVVRFVDLPDVNDP